MFKRLTCSESWTSIDSNRVLMFSLSFKSTRIYPDDDDDVQVEPKCVVIYSVW
jgi:hypothetical protein